MTSTTENCSSWPTDSAKRPTNRSAWCAKPAHLVLPDRVLKLTELSPQAMVYTLALRLKELIAEMIVRRKERIAREDDERFRREEEVRPNYDVEHSLLN